MKNNDDKLPRAMYKALQASGMKLQNYGTVFVTCAGEDKAEALPLVRRFYDMGFNIEATAGTARYLKEHGIRTRVKRKISEGSDEILDSIYKGQKVLDYPDYMVHANKTQVKILQDVDNQRVVLRPDSMVITIDVHLGGIRGLENCKSIRAAINNMRGRRYMAFDNLTEDKVAIAFEAFPNAADSCVNARFWVFGIEPSALSQDLRTLVTFFWMRGGRVFLPLDVTETFEGLKEDDKHVVISMPDLDIDLNDYIKKGGMDVDVDDWNEEFHGITF